MRIAIFGGSFNPIHNAHIKLVQRFVDEVGLQKVLFVPTNITPLKDNSNVIASTHRMNMCKLAVRGYDMYSVSDVEIKREGPSYTSDTIAYFKDKYPFDDLYLIMGADMFLTLEQWHEFRYIMNNVTILTAPRNECDCEQLNSKLSYYSKYSCKAHITKEYIEDLSSTKIRDMIYNNFDVSAFLNEDVLKYISQHNLYR